MQLLHLAADGGVVVDHLLTGAVHAGAGGALGQRRRVLLFLPLAHNLLAAEPLLHGLLVAQPRPFVHLRASGGGSDLKSLETEAFLRSDGWRETDLLSFSLRHAELIVAEQERPHLLAQRGLDAAKVDQTEQLLLLICLRAKP